MAEHRVTLKYDGRLASNHQMDAADIHHAYEGAKRLISLHAFAYTEGRVPRNKITQTPYFSIRAGAPRAGSLELDLFVGILGSMIWDATKYSFKDYFIPAIQNWLARQESHDPYFFRLDPTLTPIDSGNEPFLDQAKERQRFVHEVAVGNAQAFGQITRPIGSNCDNVELIFDRHSVAKLTHRIREHEISEAIYALRETLGLFPQRRYGS